MTLFLCWQTDSVGWMDFQRRRNQPRTRKPKLNAAAFIHVYSFTWYIGLHARRNRSAVVRNPLAGADPQHPTFAKTTGSFAGSPHPSAIFPIKKWLLTAQRHRKSTQESLTTLTKL